ncbi:MAG: Tripartite-type tricarboxylate transporter, receptor component TctC [Hyphomicrobiales bacterium]|nr:Tripartite-type tricarboxylate transporter, receptor component TctC [Hyphomicrobiales bacterium]
MRAILAAVAIAAASAAGLSAPAHAQVWPAGTVKIIVPFAAGATPDTVARLVGEKLQQRTGKPFIVENRPGAGGNTGTDAVVKAAPDGSTIGLSILGPLAMNTVLMKSMPYDPFRDVALVSMLTLQPSVLAVSNELGVNTLQELFALLKKNPGKYNYASIGRGSLSHLSMALIASRSGTEVVHVPYTGSPQAALAVVQNDVQMTVLPAISVLPLARDGKMKVLAVTSSRRSPVLPDVPTFAEAGIEGVEASAWNAMIAPAGTPPAMLEEMHRQVAAALVEPDLAAKFAAQIMEPLPMTPDQLKAYIADEFKRWSAVVKTAGIEPQ